MANSEDRSDRSKFLDPVLAPQHRLAGLYLKKDGDTVYLKRDGKVIKEYSVIDATVAKIRHDADQVINWDKSGVVFEKVR